MFHFRTAARRALVAVAAGALALTLAPGSAGAAGPPTFEVATVRAVKPTIAATIAALQEGDLTGARQAEQDYNILWHGVEVYLNFRSNPTYDVLEGDIQNRLETELAKPAASATLALGLAKELDAKYDEVITLIEAGKAIGPLFDDVQVFRQNRAYVAQGVVAELNANHAARARRFWATFMTGYPGTRALATARNTALAADLDAAVQAAAPKFADAATSIADLKPLASAVNTKIGTNLSLLNAAARNAVLTKTQITLTEVAQLIELNKVRVALTQVADNVRSGRPAEAGAAATEAAGPAFNRVKAALAAHNGADVALATALNSLVPLASGSDNAKFEPAYAAAQNAVLVAQQVIAGQFWTQPNVQRFVASLPTK
ncbi:MAG: hypothetical protein JWN67_1439 [Actinomycetia bacterium]|nr:hypothetical protein [Actinomycetes bacterium]